MQIITLDYYREFDYNHDKEDPAKKFKDDSLDGGKMIRTCLVALGFLLLATVVPAQELSLHQIVASGDIQAVDNLIKAQPQLLEERDPLGCTPLHVAAREGREAIVKLLVQKGALIDAGDTEHSTPVHLAADKGHLEIVKYLVQKGANLTLQDDNGMSALQWAAYGGNVDIAKFLLDSGADIEIAKPNGSRSMHGAANRGHLEMVKLLLSRGAQLDPSNQANFTPMLSAAAANQFEVVRYLLERGAAVNVVTIYQTTALIYAVNAGHREVVADLLARGARIESDSSEFEYPLSTAAFLGHTEIMELLIQHGANVNYTTAQNSTPLHNAAWGGHAVAVRLLLQHGAKPNAVSSSGETPLLPAVRDGYAEVVAVLLESGSDANVKEPDFGRSLLHCAAAKGYNEITKLLVKAGAQVNAVDSAGRTPLYYACDHGNRSVAKTLRKNGATPVDIALNVGKKSLLTQPRASGEAALWYLGHCGWAVKTKNHLLIFDYWNRGAGADEPCLANGGVNGIEIADQNVEVFVTHDHGDHYDSTIFTWDDKVKNLTYIFGFDPAQPTPQTPRYHSGQPYTYTAPHTQTDLDGMKITTLRSNDGGVGFLVQVDGLTLYHAGDHAGWSVPEGKGEFTQEIDYLAERISQVDLAFVNVTGCRHSGHTEELYESNAYTLGKLRPTEVIPTHGLNNEKVYREFAQRLQCDYPKVTVFAPENKGDRYVYSSPHTRPTSMR